jgi:hypothetical protein
MKGKEKENLRLRNSGTVKSNTIKERKKIRKQKKLRMAKSREEQ